MDSQSYIKYLQGLLEKIPERTGNSESEVLNYIQSMGDFIANYERMSESLLQLLNCDDKKKRKLFQEGIKILNERRSRNIPKSISDKVRERHFFECAWCGVPVTERHHIKYFEHGGNHEEENLILLCPNDHTMVHKDYIKKEDLRERKSTHKKADRLNGVFKTTAESTKVTFGKGFCEDAKNIITVKNEPRLRIYNENDNILIDAKFYNKDNQLIFWMARNIFWSVTNVNISNPKIDFLELQNDSLFYLKIFREDNGFLKVLMKTFINGSYVTIDEDYINLINERMKIGNLTLNASHIHTLLAL